MSQGVQFWNASPACGSKRRIFFLLLLTFSLSLVLLSLWYRRPAIVLSWTNYGSATGNITVYFQGRLGNTMFQLAALLCLARRNDLTPFIPYNSDITNTFTLGDPSVMFQHIRFPSDWWTTRTFQEDCNENGICRPKGYPYLQTNRPVVELRGYFQSWHYFDECEHAMRKQFRFREHIMKAVDNFFEGLKWKVHNASDAHLYVAVHVRRGDLITKRNSENGYMVAPPEYLKRAMKYFSDKYSNSTPITFIVCSDSMKWVKSTLSSSEYDVTYAEGNTPEVDLAIMAHCNHSILTVGSFGWWAGWLANGEVVYFKTQARPGSWLGKRFNNADYFPPSWTAME